MSRFQGNTIADSLDLGLRYAERLLTGVTTDNFCRLAFTGRARVQSNHPAFIFGHLSLYAPQIISHLGTSHSPMQVPDHFEALFSKDATCRDDPDKNIYPTKDVITQFFFESYREAAEALRVVEDQVLKQPNPTEGRMRQLFPTSGSMLAFYGGGHLMMHLGQMSAWRRMIGLRPA